MPNFDEINQSKTQIKLLQVFENKLPPQWNSIFGFDIDLGVVIDVSFCTRLSNFVVIGR